MLSTNSGTSWNWAGAPSAEWHCLAASANAKQLLAGSRGLLYRSRDSGQTWTPATVPSAFWICAASSADGATLMAGAYGGAVYTSTDSGSTWSAANLPVASWHSVASSADGSRLLAAAMSGLIYTSQRTPTPALTLTPSGGSLVLSWTLPSLEFAVQQNTQFGTTTWMTLTNVPNLNLAELRNELRLTPSAGGGFYRLISK